MSSMKLCILTNQKLTQLRESYQRDRDCQGKKGLNMTIWRQLEKFLKNSLRDAPNNYSVGEYVTLDEMLESFRGKCRFRQYIANKPAKIRHQNLQSSWFENVFTLITWKFYPGKQPAGPFYLSNDAASVMKRLISTIDKSGRNITVDNYFYFDTAYQWSTCQS